MSDSIEHNGKKYFEEGLLKLANENAERSRAALESEKQRRIYYQDIVYAVCTSLDAMLPGRAVCGTIDDPSTDVQDRMLALRKILRSFPAREVMAAREKAGYAALMSVTSMPSELD